MKNMDKKPIKKVKPIKPLTQKKKICKTCETEKFIWKNGSCKSCSVKLDREKKAKKSEIQKERKKLNSITHNKVKTVIQKLSRIVNSNFCVSCGHHFTQADINKGLQHGGHFIPASRHTTAYYLLNIHPQCARCNIFENGNQYEYGKYMEKTYGVDFVEWLNKISRLTYKWSKQEMRDIFETALSFIERSKDLNKEETKRLKKEFVEWQESTLWFNTINNELKTKGIE